MIMKALLTDFSKEPWENVNLGRIKELIEELNEKAEDGRLIGEMGQPFTYDPDNSLAYDINLKNASHVIKKVWMEDDKVYGEIEFLKTEKGLEARYTIEGNFGGFGIRAVGKTLEEFEEKSVVLKKIFTWDVIPNARKMKVRIDSSNIREIWME